MGICTRRKFYNIITIFLSILGWVMVGLTLLWYLVALFSIFFYSVSLDGLYIPSLVQDTKFTISIIVMWTLIVCTLSFMWIRYNNIKLPKRKVSNRPLLVNTDTTIPWSEAIIEKNDTENIFNERERLIKSLSIIRFHPSIDNSRLYKMEPEKLLSIAVTLIEKGRFLNGMSLLRIVLEHQKASLFVKKIAKIKLTQCFYELGYESFVIGLAE